MIGIARSNPLSGFGMQWISALSTRPALESALAEVAEQVTSALSAPLDLGFVFLSSSFASDYPRLMPLLQEVLPARCWIGCAGGGIVGSRDGRTREIEETPAVSVLVGSLPGARVQPFHLLSDDVPDLDSPPQAWSDRLGVDPADHPDFVLLADPFNSPLADILQGLDFAYPQAVKVGGLASGEGLGNRPVLFLNERTLNGCVGVALSGSVGLRAIVAQGCRPIGGDLEVLEAERNIIRRVRTGDGGEMPLVDALRQTLGSLSEAERELAQHSLFLGVARSAFQLNLEAGDYLIRNLLGVDPRTGAMAVGDRIRIGQRIRFHLRDARTSADDLEHLLQRDRQQRGPETAQAALMFACLGRGQGLYGQPDFDSGLFQHYLPQTPLSGVFCNGEVGPIGDGTFLHGYTSVFGILEARS